MLNYSGEATECVGGTTLAQYVSAAVLHLVSGELCPAERSTQGTFQSPQTGRSV